MKAIVLAGLLLFAVLLFGGLWMASDAPQVRVVSDVKVVGQSTPVVAQITSPHGLRRISAYLEQGSEKYPVYEVTSPATRWMFWRKSEPPKTIEFNAGKQAAPKLKDGRARLVVEAVANDLRASETAVARDLEVNTRPPAVSADGLQHYINQGGSELITFTTSGYWTESGVRVGKYSFRSFPLPGKPRDERFALFAYPWDLPAGETPVVYARNPSGAEATAKFWFKLFPKKFRSRDLAIDDSFLGKVVPQIDHGAPGALLERFLKINSQLRAENNRRLASLREQSEPAVLWSGPFLQLGNSKVESFFADRRSYIYQGRKVDEQMHLGFDLSVTKNVPVLASNSGKVVLAEDLGIYGNCVVVDHGYGLQSIYGHLSKIGVKPGDQVRKSQPLGLSGATGLAGGDHLHYSMQVDGVQVNPVEWWDEHWIKDRILSKLPAAK